MDERHMTKQISSFSSNKQVCHDGNEYFLCSACRTAITDEFYLRAGVRVYHPSCLQCSVCAKMLDEQSTCFFKESRLFCREDYQRYFANKCPKCNRLISPNDWIRRACDHVYHLTCFACHTCERQLSTGEEYSLEGEHILCKPHIIGANEDRTDDEKQSRTKRIRTAFNEEQLQVLQASFEMDQNPDGQELEHISQIIGLSKRVIQVWFQNTRARQKKQKYTSRARLSSDSSNSSASNDGLLKGTARNWFQQDRTILKAAPNVSTGHLVKFDDLATNRALNHRY